MSQKHLASALAWFRTKLAFLDARGAEMSARKQLIQDCFPSIQPGTNTLELPRGYALKAVMEQDYKLDAAKTKAALAQLRAEGAAGELLADRLVKWTPEISVREYKALSPEQKAYFADALTIKDGTPSLTLVEPGQA